MARRHCRQSIQRLLIPALRRYNSELNVFGAKPKGVLWRDEDGATRRFRVLGQILPELPSAGLTVHDFGCGYGALFDFLSEHPIMRNEGRYVGTDMVEAMLDAARARVTDPRARFSYGVDAAEPADYTLVSGTFNLRVGHDETEWTAYLEHSITMLWQQSRRGLAFNLLHDCSLGQHDDLYYADARRFHRFARTLAPNVELLVPAARVGIVAALGAVVGTPASALVPVATVPGDADAVHRGAFDLLRAAMWATARIRVEPLLPVTDITILMRR
jgi:SAM-dependent methyltransferase